tara:strand:- start:40 stop:429 length:390 start_codon:yes stop_codon:yes gene_type:complete
MPLRIFLELSNMTKINQQLEATNNPSGNEPVENIETEGEPVFKPQNELPFPTEIDLNELFPKEDKDLNELFPDEETKLLLKKMQKNKKDMHIMTDRFLDEDWSSDALDGLSGNGEAEIEDIAETRTEET